MDDTISTIAHTDSELFQAPKTVNCIIPCTQTIPHRLTKRMQCKCSGHAPMTTGSFEELNEGVNDIEKVRHQDVPMPKGVPFAAHQASENKLDEIRSDESIKGECRDAACNVWNLPLLNFVAEDLVRIRIG